MEPHAHETTALLTMTEAATALGIGRTRLNQIVRSGALSTVFLGARRRVRRVDLDRFVSSLPGTGGQK